MYLVDDIMSKPTEESRAAKYKYAIDNFVLFAIGSSWDIFAKLNSSGGCVLYSVAKPGTGGINSYFGDCNHVRRLIKRGIFTDVLTDAGRELMEIY